MTTESLSDVVELATAHARKQFEAVTAQSKELAALIQKVTTETSKPMMKSLTKTIHVGGLNFIAHRAFNSERNPYSNGTINPSGQV
jgi:hypothetical protein